MPDPPVELTVAGTSYRVFSSLPTEELLHLARTLDGRIQAFNPHRELTHNQALLYAALALTHDLEREQIGRKEFQATTRQTLLELLECIDATMAKISASDAFTTRGELPTDSKSIGTGPVRAAGDTTGTETPASPKP